MTTGEPIRVMKFVSNFCIGGTERQFVVAAANLDRREFDVHVGCFDKAGAFLETVTQHGLPVSEYAIDSLYNARSLRLRWRLARYIRRHRIQLVHAYGFYPNLFAVPAARLGGARAVVASIRDSGDLYTPLQRRAQRLVLRMADRIVVNAHAIADGLAGAGYDRGRLAVIHNGIETGRLTAEAGRYVRRELSIPEGTPVVTVVARLSRNARGVEFKGIGHFLDAVAGLRTRVRDARYLIVGDGPSRDELEAYAGRLGLAGVVRFLGFRLDVPEILGSSTIAVLPSLTEGLSNSLLEAMAAGLPVVATRVGGNPEALGEGGVLVPPADVRALAAAIEALLVDAERRARLGEAARRRVLSHFSVRRMLSDTEDLYRALTGGGRSVPRVGIPATEGRWS